MSSYAYLAVKGRTILSWRNEVEPYFLFMFKQADLFQSSLGNADSVLRAAYEMIYPANEEVAFFRVTSGALKDRLNALGIGLKATREVFEGIRSDDIEIARDISAFDAYPDESRELIGAARDEKLAKLESTNFDTWLADLRDYLSRKITSDTEVSDLRNGPTDDWDYADQRYLLRAVTEVLEEDEELLLDVTELLGGGWLDTGTDPQQSALENFGWALTSGSPPIIVTEGSTDARAISKALEILRPHLVSYLRFLDFGAGNEGGAAAAVRTTKSLASAGVSNRVILLLDNDSAARDAIRSLDVKKLPKHFGMMHYPPLHLGSNYPTKGPTGDTCMDINGLAGSIELYMGEDALRDDSMQLRPVQWTGYMSKLDAYQGEVIEKTQIQKAFFKKCAAAVANPEVTDKQDWSGMQTLIDELLRFLSS